MRKHVNQQYYIKRSRWPRTPALSTALSTNTTTQLWKLVQVQTFFYEKRYRRYFLVQEPEQPPLYLLLEQRDVS
jgi:hypothetical protein